MALRRSVAVALAGTITLLLVIASPAPASGAPPMPLTDAIGSSDLVLVGTVTSARSNNRIATVAVEDLWKGESDAVIEVAGGPDAANRATSVDRTYTVGTRYLFFIFEPVAHGSPGTFGARYEDNNCTDTRPYTADLDSLRPVSARRVASSPPTAPAAPAPAASSSDSAAVSYIAAAAGSAVAVALLAIVIRRRRAMRAITQRPGLG